MQIDWFTVAAQAVNFLILMWLLKRFLYKPILNAIAAREKHITDQLANAAQSKAEAQKEQEAFKQKNAAFDKNKATLLSTAKAEAETFRAALIKDTEAEAQIIRAKKKTALQAEMHDLSSDIARQTKEQVFAAASKVLIDLADTTLQDRMIAVFIKNLQGLSKQDKDALSCDTAVIASAFTLSSAQKKSLKDEIKTETLKFKIVPELVSGIELSVQGHKLAWSISNYLETLEQESSHAA